MRNLFLPVTKVPQELLPPFFSPTKKFTSFITMHHKKNRKKPYSLVSNIFASTISVFDSFEFEFAVANVEVLRSNADFAHPVTAFNCFLASVVSRHTRSEINRAIGDV